MPAALAAVKAGVMKAEEWLQKNKNDIRGTVFRPVAWARIIKNDDDQVKSRLRELYRKPVEDWTPSEDEYFDSVWSFQFNNVDDIEYFLAELRDKQNFLVNTEVI